MLIVLNVLKVLNVLSVLNMPIGPIAQGPIAQGPIDTRNNQSLSELHYANEFPVNLIYRIRDLQYLTATPSPKDPSPKQPSPK